MPLPDRPIGVVVPITPVICFVRSRDGMLILWTHPETGHIYRADGYPYN
mgnify:CR=1 FL=1